MAVASAGHLGLGYGVAHGVPAVALVAEAPVVEHSAPAHYDFEYAVSDPHTGDAKSQKESRRGDSVHGSYSLVDSDGTKRTVEYTADAHNGFNAVVHKEPLAVHPVAPVVAPAVATYAHAPAIAAYGAGHFAAGHYAAAPAVAHYETAHIQSAPILTLAGPIHSFGHGHGHGHGYY